MEGKAVVIPSQMILGVKLRDDARFDNFHGDRNREAARRLEAICDAPQGLPVVVVCGDSDTGKSHLLQAACNKTDQFGRAGVCISIGELLPFGPDALDGLDVHPLLCLDDLEKIAGKADWEEAIFHLYNRVMDRGGLLLVSMSEVPGSLPFGLPDLVSRLSHGLLLQLGLYRDEDRMHILMARAEQRGLVVSDDVANFIMRRAPRKLGDLLGILDTLDENSLQAQRRLTIPFVKTVMGW
ncbi:MAG: DnaA regulatory inactivator Hda [Marinobacter sp.]|uniref:DnaA regulatory inactivator Hda n=2 Tax=unclassified Marinobacter TaxID=83889 RepID=UPI00273AAE9C|nr:MULTISPECIES: DnaA regulatory inactivator Hda [unclassified Marinobacter]MDP4548789.1 DnaA regulatory inactivator Hda [Marinobacter sp. MDS2]